MKKGDTFQSKNDSINNRFKDFDDLLDIDYSNNSRQASMPNPIRADLTSHNNFLGEAGFTIDNIKNDVITFVLP